jgi:hypothetical protein
VWNGELFWGREHLPLLAERMAGRGEADEAARKEALG